MGFAERDRVIAESLARGDTLQKVATTLGLSKSGVHQIAKRLGVSLVDRREIARTTTEDMALLYRAGKTGTEIAAIFKVNPPVVYARMHRIGLVANPKQPAPLWERLAKRFEFASGCWIWNGSRDPHGYGVLKYQEKGTTYFAHRLVYQELVGPIGDKLVIDHLCRTPECVNPQHLQAVPSGENVRRGKRVGRPLCKAGHEMSGANLYVGTTTRGGIRRACRRCGAEAATQRREAKRAAKQGTKS